MVDHKQNIVNIQAQKANTRTTSVCTSSFVCDPSSALFWGLHRYFLQGRFKNLKVHGDRHRCFVKSSIQCRSIKRPLVHITWLLLSTAHLWHRYIIREISVLQNALLPAGLRQRDQTKKAPTGTFHRDNLMAHLEKQAIEHPERDDLVPFTGEKRGNTLTQSISYLKYI